MPEKNNDDLEEVISYKPTWIVRNGFLILFFFVSILLLFTWFIKYPDIIKARITITTSPPPLYLLSRSSGYIQLLKNEGDLVGKHEPIGFINTNVNLNDLNRVSALLDNFETSCDDLTKCIDLETKLAHESFELGDLQSHLSRVITDLKSVNLFKSLNTYQTQIFQVSVQIEGLIAMNKILQQQLLLQTKEFEVDRNKFKTDSILFVTGVISSIEYEAAKAKFYQQKRILYSAESSVVSNRIQCASLVREKFELIETQLKEENTVTTALFNSIFELRAAIQSWKDKFIFMSPSKGKVAFLGFFESGQFVEQGKTIASIIPDSRSFYGMGTMKVSGAGKVKEGQRVNILLDDFPYDEFGTITGFVSNISPVSFNGEYTLTIRLSKGLETSYNKSLTFKQQLTGTTEIITEDLRLIERVFYWFKKSISRH